MHRYPTNPNLRLFPRIAMGTKPDAFWDGAVAAVRGEGFNLNPHGRESAEWLQWAEGHNAYRAGQIRSRRLLVRAGVLV